MLLGDITDFKISGPFWSLKFGGKAMGRWRFGIGMEWRIVEYTMKRKKGGESC
jgi:hypothetical protein